MYRKTLIALACAVISAPAFAQSECPHDKLTRAPCSILTFPTPPPPPPPVRTTADEFGYVRQNPPPPPSTDIHLPQGTFGDRGMSGGVVTGIQRHF
jgi:hypothetical protein